MGEEKLSFWCIRCKPPRRFDQLYQIKEMPPEEPFQPKIVTLRKARKEHICNHCHQLINRGEEYCEVVIGGGGLGSLKFPDRVHQHCIDNYLRR